MIKNWVTSDTHFYHLNIIRYCSRPFKNITHMNEAIIERWNSRVAPEDTIYFLGDFAMGPESNVESVRNIIRRLNGFKNFLFGNHDEPSKWGPGLWPSLGEDDGKIDNMFDVTIDGRRFIMNHYPLVDWPGKNNGAVHLHGHTHTEFHPDAMGIQNIGQYDIGVDMYGGPVEITGDLRYLNDPKGWN